MAFCGRSTMPASTRPCCWRRSSTTAIRSTTRPRCGGATIIWRGWFVVTATASSASRSSIRATGARPTNCRVRSRHSGCVAQRWFRPAGGPARNACSRYSPGRLHCSCRCCSTAASSSTADPAASVGHASSRCCATIPACGSHSPIWAGPGPTKPSPSGSSIASTACRRPTPCSASTSRSARRRLTGSKYCAVPSSCWAPNRCSSGATASCPAAAKRSPSVAAGSSS